MNYHQKYKKKLVEKFETSELYDDFINTMLEETMTDKLSEMLSRHDELSNSDLEMQYDFTNSQSNGLNLYGTIYLLPFIPVKYKRDFSNYNIVTNDTYITIPHNNRGTYSVIPHLLDNINYVDVDNLDSMSIDFDNHEAGNLTEEIVSNVVNEAIESALDTIYSIEKELFNYGEDIFYSYLTYDSAFEELSNYYDGDSSLFTANGIEVE